MAGEEVVQVCVSAGGEQGGLAQATGGERAIAGRVAGEWLWWAGRGDDGDLRA